MIDFIVNLFAEIADFFITFWVDNVIEIILQSLIHCKGKMDMCAFAV